MSDENPEMRFPDDEEYIVEMVGAETVEEENLAVAQAKLIGDL